MKVNYRLCCVYTVGRLLVVYHQGIAPEVDDSHHEGGHVKKRRHNVLFNVLDSHSSSSSSKSENEEGGDGELWLNAGCICKHTRGGW